MIINQKICERCLSKSNDAATFCGNCGGKEFRQSSLKLPLQGKGLYVGLALSVAAISGYIFVGKNYISSIREQASETATFAAVEPTSVVSETPAYPEIAVGKTIEWSAEKSLAPITYRIGQMTVTINRDDDGDLVFPKLVIEHLGQTVEVKGATTIPEYSHQISAVANSGETLMLFESFSGGAHCCVKVSVVGVNEGKLRLYDFGEFDGSRIPFPSDVSGDGVADFVISDDRFLYSFAPYAYSVAPSRIFNIRNGKVVQVSGGRKFEKILLKEMTGVRELCVNGTSGYERNGACPAYLALASKVGRTQLAWNEMIGAYDASVDWELPTGCLKKVNKSCSDRDAIHYKSYPEALLAFLKDAGYIGQSWLPKAARPVYQGQDVPNVDFGNTT